jgi:hypothetical protein
MSEYRKWYYCVALLGLLVVSGCAVGQEIDAPLSLKEQKSCTVINIQKESIWENVWKFVLESEKTNKNIILCDGLRALNVSPSRWQSIYYHQDHEKIEMLLAKFDINGNLILSERIQSIMEEQNTGKKYIIQCDIPKKSNARNVLNGLLKLAGISSVLDLAFIKNEVDVKTLLEIPLDDKQTHAPTNE